MRRVKAPGVEYVYSNAPDSAERLYQAYARIFEMAERRMLHDEQKREVEKLSPGEHKERGIMIDNNANDE
jgi:hypothetical protein